MNKVIIECNELIEQYELSKEGILKQLETIKIENNQDFVIVYDKNFRFTLVGEMSKNNNSIVLTNIIKADEFREMEMDNSDLFEFIKRQG